MSYEYARAKDFLGADYQDGMSPEAIRIAVWKKVAEQSGFGLSSGNVIGYDLPLHKIPARGYSNVTKMKFGKEVKEYSRRLFGAMMQPKEFGG